MKTHSPQTEAFFEKNWKAIVSAVAVAVVIVGAYFAYEGLYSAPRAKKSSSHDVRSRTDSSASRSIKPLWKATEALPVFWK
ncbi:MAG: hypothetical protein L6V35_01515 [Alistipes putredinis]|nr:MAG: hypothetical protein L6V35_01515 [Alistipes putredinis]